MSLRRLFGSSFIALNGFRPIIDGGSVKWLFALDLPYSHVPFHQESIFPEDKTNEDDESRLFFFPPFIHAHD